MFSCKSLDSHFCAANCKALEDSKVAVGLWGNIEPTLVHGHKVDIESKSRVVLAPWKPLNPKRPCNALIFVDGFKYGKVFANLSWVRAMELKPVKAEDSRVEDIEVAGVDSVWLLDETEGMGNALAILLVLTVWELIQRHGDWGWVCCKIWSLVCLRHLALKGLKSENQFTF